MVTLPNTAREGHNSLYLDVSLHYIEIEVRR